MGRAPLSDKKVLGRFAFKVLGVTDNLKTCNLKTYNLQLKMYEKDNINSDTDNDDHLRRLCRG